MTHAEAAAILADQAPKCPYCGAPGRLQGENYAGATYQCQSHRCDVRDSWTVPTEPAPVVDTTGYALESLRAA